MQQHVLIELLGGPEDGRELVVPTATEDGPLSPLPVPTPRNDSELDAQLDPESETAFGTHTAWYERDHRRGKQGWVYRYVTSHPTTPDDSPANIAPTSDMHG